MLSFAQTGFKALHRCFIKYYYLRQVNKFKYIGVAISEKGGSEEAVRARVSAAWGKWRDLSGVIGDKKMPRKLKFKLYMTVIRPVLLYGAECWTVGKKEEQILEKTEMRMLQSIKGVTLRDKVKSVDIRKELGVTSIQEKVREMSRLVWTMDTCREWKKTTK